MVFNTAVLARPEASRVGALAKSGAVWSIARSIIRYVVGLGSTVILSRLLPPADYGIAAMATTIVTFSQWFADMGLSWATVQRSEMNEGQVANLFWANATFGFLLWVIAILSGPALNSFFGRKELAAVAAVTGFGLFVNGLAAQPIALMRRQMKLKALCLIEIAAVASAAFVGIAAAFRGWGYWSLVAQGLTSQILMLVLVFHISGFRVRRPRPDREMRGLLAFGGFMSGYAMLSYLAQNVDNMIVGRVLGAEALGLYSRAYFLMMLPSIFAGSSLQSTMVPALAILRPDPEAFDRAYRRATAAIAYIAFPLSAGIGVTAREFVVVLYRQTWAGAAPALAWLSIGGLFLSVNTFSWLYIASGKERQFFLWGFVPVGVLTGAFLIGIHWGILGMGVAYGLSMALIIFPLGFHVAFRTCGLSMGPAIRDLAYPLFATCVMALGVFGVGRLLQGISLAPATALLIKVVTGAAIYVPLCGKRALHTWHGTSLPAKTSAAVVTGSV